MAKSGQCNSQKRQPIQSSALTTVGEPVSSRSMTFLGQKALQIPQALHQDLKMICSYRGTAFFSRLPLGEVFSSVTFVSPAFCVFVDFLGLLT
jgi:hypothetical protein